MIFPWEPCTALPRTWFLERTQHVTRQDPIINFLSFKRDFIKVTLAVLGGIEPTMTGVTSLHNSHYMIRPRFI